MSVPSMTILYGLSNLGIEEQKAYYSNKGDGIDIYAPADDMLAAGSPTSGYQDYLIWNTLH